MLARRSNRESAHTGTTANSWLHRAEGREKRERKGREGEGERERGSEGKRERGREEERKKGREEEKERQSGKRVVEKGMAKKSTEEERWEKGTWGKKM